MVTSEVALIAVALFLPNLLPSRNGLLMDGMSQPPILAGPAALALNLLAPSSPTAESLLIDI
jgi:hypothetical protein